MKPTSRLIQDMLLAIASIESYSVTTYDALLTDEKTQDAIMYNLIIMGEAANQIPHAFHESHQEIPWSSIIGTRNMIVHGYDQVKLQIVWDIIQENLQPLKINLTMLLE
jgi:uncharacterized protein with HEPN domain